METIAPVGAAEGSAVGTNQLPVPTLVLAAVSGENGMMVNDTANDSAGINSVAAVQTHAKGLRTDHALQ